MQPQKIVARDEWFKAHKAHLAQEKEFTRQRDQLAAKRLELPWLKVEQSYTFDTERGKKTLSELFADKSQLAVYHFMLTPHSEHRCPGCSFLSDHIDAANQHLRHHDVSVVVASRAPLAEILPFKKRMGWQFDWVSSGESDFNYDFEVSYSDAQVASGRMVYNFEERSGLKPAQMPRDLPGLSVFYKDESGDVYLTFEVRARGGEALIGAYQWLDLMPKGRNETEQNPMKWVRLHDQYER
ncbi:MAG: hypothetical protein RL701_677 [Pseudomonadota bacterium]